MARLFVDSWGWIALGNRRDPAHDRVCQVYRHAQLEGLRMVTTDYILDEVITFLYARTPLLRAAKYLSALWAALTSQRIQLESIERGRFEAAWAMRTQYRDHPAISFTDFTSFVVMRELQIQQVLTNDRHFEQVNLGFRRLP